MLIMEPVLTLMSSITQFMTHIPLTRICPPALRQDLEPRKRKACGPAGAPALGCPSGKGCGRVLHRGARSAVPRMSVELLRSSQHCQLPWGGGLRGGHLVSAAGALRERREGLGGSRGQGLERELGVSSVLLCPQALREWVRARKGPSAPAHVRIRSG